MTPISRTLPEKIILALETMHEKTPLSSASGLLLCVLNVSLSYTAIMSNIVTVHAVRKTSSLSKNLKTLLLSQAVSDIGVGLVAQPLYVARMILYWSQGTENNPTYFAIMIMHIIASNLFSFATIHGAMALCTDRFMAVHLHLRYQELVTHKRVVGVVILIWALSGFLSFARLWMTINFMYAILAVVVSACIVTATFFSVKICWFVRRHVSELHVLQAPQVTQNGQMANILRLRKFAIASVYLHLVFLICYLPNILTSFAVAFTSYPLSIKLKALHGYSLTLLYLNSSINPLIYCWKMKHIRHTVINILRNTF